MYALVFDRTKTTWEESKGFEKVEVPRPTIDETQNPDDANVVLIKVQYAGVCGSDRGIWYRQAFRDQILGSLEAEEKAYRVIGHEFFGVVQSVGSHVKNIQAGDFVTCESHVVCNECYQCERGEKHVCTNEKILGISHDGGFAEYAKVPAHIVWKTNTNIIRPEIAVMQEPFGNAVHAASKVDLKGKTVAIFGLGPIGMFLTLVAKGLGAAMVIGIEPNPVAQDMAKKLGIDHIIPLNGTPSADKPYAHNQEVTDEIVRLTGGVGVDVSFEMSGFNSSANNCLFATRRGGDVILFGIKTGDFVFEDYNRLIVRGLTLHAVVGREVFATWETTRALLERTENGIQEKLFNVMLNGGTGSILPFTEYTKERFEEMMRVNPKILLQF